MDQAIRNKLRAVVTQCRRLLEDSVRQELQSKFGIYAAKKDDVQVDEENRLKLTTEERPARKDILDYFAHIKARGFKAKDALDQLVREIAFTHLNRLCAYKMMEARDVVLSSDVDHTLKEAYGNPPKFREAVSRGVNSNGVKRYLAYHEKDERLFKTGKQEVAYRHFLDWLGGLLSKEIGVLFNPHDSANRLYPTQHVLDQVLALINDESLTDIWAQDETIGWVYQYFTPKELRDQARKESAAPRNSYELAFRNQFFTPRYVVEFLTDNTLGRIWYEMLRGKTKLKDQCRYIFRRPNEVFLGDPVAASRLVPISVEKADDIPATVKAAFQGDFANAVTEKGGLHRYWIGLVVPPDQYEAATGQPFRENDDHPSVKEVWSTIHEHPEDVASLDPLKILVALSQLVLTASSGPYAAKAAGELWAALTTAVKAQTEQGDLSQDELLKQPVCIPFRAKKDPRELRILDPACGSGHFLLYCFDLLLTIYEEAYADPDLGPSLKEEYPTLDALRRDVPRLILAHNLHGIDIDLRCTQIAALALWLRCQRTYREMALKHHRPKITKSNIVCAEPMPGEKEMLDEFLKTLKQDRLEALIGRVMKVPEGSRVRATQAMVDSLTDLVRLVWQKMQLAGEAGSLLKIEEELQDAVRKGQEEWEEKLPLFRFTEFSLTEAPKESYVRYVPGEGVSFWQRAEALVLEALRDYARHTATGGRLQRQLFADDAERGFAFIDTCHKQFDVLLMNPPFGLPCPSTYSMLVRDYPTGYSDIAAAFMSFSTRLVIEGGLLGSITTRSYLQSSDLGPFRKELFLPSVILLLDLGPGVMDEAWVEASAQVLGSGDRLPRFTVIDRRQLPDDLKADVLSMDGVSGSGDRLYFPQRTAFESVPKCRVTYDASSALSTLITSPCRLKPERIIATTGLRTFDDERFYRLRWEIKSTDLGPTRTWCDIAKNTDFGCYYMSYQTVVKWCGDGKELAVKNTEVNGQTAQARQGSRYYFQPGLCFSRRSEPTFSVRVHPASAAFSSNGGIVIPRNAVSIYYLAGLLNSSPFRAAVKLLANKYSYTSGHVEVLAWHDPSAKSEKLVAQAASDAIKAKILIESTAETDPYFVGYTYLREKDSLRTCVDTERTRRRLLEARIVKCGEMIDAEICALYSLDMEQSELSEKYRASVADLAKSEAGSDVPYFEYAAAVISYCVGCLLGRWNMRCLIGTEEVVDPAPFAPLPVCSPGMLQGKDGLPLGKTPGGYPLRIDWEGIIPDDPDHSDDIVGRVQKALELIWKDRAEAIETEACEILGVENLRQYFRKPGKGGFWDDHVSRYSKSRRKAPIYWLLQSSKKNYALWLYYNRLDKETLLKALLPKGPVQTKINLEQSRLDDLRKKRKSAEGDTKSAKKLDKEIDKQEDLLNEIKDFAERLERAAKLEFGDKDKLNSNVQYTPDLNDGVVLNIAPLHELVPWKPAADYWQELLDGEYEWSSMSKLLREKGLVK